MFYHKLRILKQLVNYLQSIDGAYEKLPIEVNSIFFQKTKSTFHLISIKATYKEH